MCMEEGGVGWGWGGGGGHTGGKWGLNLGEIIPLNLLSGTGGDVKGGGGGPGDSWRLSFEETRHMVPIWAAPDPSDGGSRGGGVWR